MATTYTQVIGAKANVLHELTYNNIIFESQKAIWTFLRGSFENTTDTTIKTKNVLDRAPEELTKGVGFPYIVIPYPEIQEEFFTFTQKRIFVDFAIEVWFKKDAKKVADNVRTFLNNKRVFLNTKLVMHQFLHKGSVFETIELDDHSIVSRYTLNVRYEWTGLT